MKQQNDSLLITIILKQHAYASQSTQELVNIVRNSSRKLRGSRIHNWSRNMLYANGSISELTRYNHAWSQGS